jgi:hypothetical protein
MSPLELTVDILNVYVPVEAAVKGSATLNHPLSVVLTGVQTFSLSAITVPEALRTLSLTPPCEVVLVLFSESQLIYAEKVYAVPDVTVAVLDIYF